MTECSATVVELPSGRLLVAWFGGLPGERAQITRDFQQTFPHALACWRTADRCWSVTPTAAERLHAFLRSWVRPEQTTWVALHGGATADRPA